MQENPSSGFLTRSDTNRPVQLQDMVRGQKVWISKVEEFMYYPCSENKGADQLICAFVFAYANCLVFS